MQALFFLIGAVLALGATNAETLPSLPAPIMSEAVYQILNKFDSGALTVDERSTESVLVFLREYNATAGQKWRLRASIGDTFYLSPTSNEKADLDLDRNTLGIWGRLFSFGSQKRWNLVWMGEGVYQIRNSHTPDLCLTTQGLDRLVGVADCENSPSQQWIFTLL